MSNLSLMNHPNLVVVHYNSYAGGKFWINCLSHSRYAIPGLCVAEPQHTVDLWLLDDLDAEEIQRRKIARINSTLPPADLMHKWCQSELGCNQFWGYNFHEFLTQDLAIPKTTIQLLNQYRCFIVNHRPQNEIAKNICDQLPSAKHIILKNASNFQNISMSKKQSGPWTLTYDTTDEIDAFVVDVDNTYLDVDCTITRVKECLEYLGISTELDPNIHNFVTSYFDLHR